MYLDSIVVLGLIIVVLTCAMITYVGFYAYKHFKADMKAYQEELANKSV